MPSGLLALQGPQPGGRSLPEAQKRLRPDSAGGRAVQAPSQPTQPFSLVRLAPHALPSLQQLRRRNEAGCGCRVRGSMMVHSSFASVLQGAAAFFAQIALDPPGGIKPGRTPAAREAATQAHAAVDAAEKQPANKAKRSKGGPDLHQTRPPIRLCTTEAVSRAITPPALFGALRESVWHPRPGCGERKLCDPFTTDAGGHLAAASQRPSVAAASQANGEEYWSDGRCIIVEQPSAGGRLGRAATRLIRYPTVDDSG